MSSVLSKIREELYKVSEIDMEEEEIVNINAIEEFIDNIAYFRNASEGEIIENFRSIFYSGTACSIKLLFFIRDKINGLGERRIFRVILRYLANEHPKYIKDNLSLIPKYGRWDDLYSLFDTKLEDDVIDLFKNQLQIDLNSNKPSTLAKWLKSENTSSKESKKLGNKTRRLLGYSPKEYRRLLSSLRKKIDIVETNISRREYSKINYKNLTKLNIKKYKKAFLRNDRVNYEKFKMENNKNTFIFESIEKMISIIRNDLNNYNINSIEDMYIKNLEYLIDINIRNLNSFEDTLIVNGIEGEFTKDQNKYFDVLIATILLYNKMNSNSFKNYYMSFKKNSKFNKLTGSNYIEDIQIISKNKVNYNIDLNSALDLLLFTSIKKNLKSEAIPKSIMFIYNKSEAIDFIDIDEMNEKWGNSGFKIPRIKFWNLNNLSPKFSIKYKDSITIINGYNNSIWKYLLESKEISNGNIIIDKFNNIEYKDLII
ncbi:DUF2828 domain-containing protein [Clostridium sp. DSM 100503]|uniref:DUF2828 domain-containing protein n=1 Tax=Clostridium sp. DSM 100503 TaxID=2963282 RepID=UPI00214A3885|nr:DUF2828 domain-containing protein [Clostridium sp. DSM 100503]MCR1950055.1 DUF2828 domain-containing protein [Clostridium sp. DSM 100503]